MKKPVQTLIALFIAGLSASAVAAENLTGLPPTEMVARVLQESPTVQAAASTVRAEEANRRGLEAGQYEWNVRVTGQQRRSNPANASSERFSEWNAALERPVLLPGKAGVDAELGAAGVALAEVAHGDAIHETSRNLLKSWFTWLKESAGAEQWAKQVTLLEKQSQAVSRRQQLGDAAQLEAIQAAASLAQARAELAQAKARQESAAEELRRRYPGLPVAMPAEIGEPTAIDGSETDWVNAILEHNHELGMARRESQLAQLTAGRASRDRLPDPTFGVHVGQERGGEEKIVGAYLSIPLPGGARRAASDSALARADAASRREAAATRKVSAEASVLYQSAHAALSSWQASRNAADGLSRAAEMTARAYQLGEGSLNDLLTARRFANEAQLTARTMQLDALELRYRLLLDAHRLWDLDGGQAHAGE